MSERFLANENFPAGMVRILRTLGDDVVHAAETLVGAQDPIILQTALEQDRILLTFDHDFGELVYRQRKPAAPGIVLFRFRQQAPEILLTELQSFFAARPTLRGYFTVVSPGQFRQTPLGSQDPA